MIPSSQHTSCCGMPRARTATAAAKSPAPSPRSTAGRASPRCVRTASHASTPASARASDARKAAHGGGAQGRRQGGGGVFGAGEEGVVVEGVDDLHVVRREIVGHGQAEVGPVPLRREPGGHRMDAAGEIDGPHADAERVGVAIDEQRLSVDGQRPMLLRRCISKRAPRLVVDREVRVPIDAAGRPADSWWTSGSRTRLSSTAPRTQRRRAPAR